MDRRNILIINSLIDALAVEVYDPSSTEQEQLERLAYIGERAEKIFTEWSEADPIQRMEKFFDAASYWRATKDIVDE